MLILHGGGGEGGGHCPVSAFFYCVGIECGWIGGWGGRPKAAMSRSVVLNDVCGKVCVCLSKEGV